MRKGGPLADAGALREFTVAGLHEALIDSLPVLPEDAPVLDVGCGTGAWLARLAHQGHRSLWGIDRRTDLARPAVAQWVEGDLDAPDWNLPRRDFALVTAIEVVEHLENHGLFYSNVAANLAPGGFFLITTPNIHSTTARLRFLLSGKLGQFDDKGDPTHLQPILLAGLHRAMPRHGLEIVRTWGYPEKGTIVHRRLIASCATVLAPFVPEDLPGDVLCALARKNVAPA